MTSKGRSPLTPVSQGRAIALLTSCNSRSPFTTFSRAKGDRSFWHRKVDRNF
ncbi:hypothetical protein [Microcoleus sp. bin38.metabat.b11b12b14.051]|uniref:hypothetical protein n=1 Tax=Microcoleus sp. bin38.metabat.b11b12b14.051 TaxID=2742709 RepID=UPI0025D6D83B|nr:hypothetical protein [Microcoleus sp. bin38.metabat.b11b12b14.051]